MSFRAYFRYFLVSIALAGHATPFAAAEDPCRGNAETYAHGRQIVVWQDPRSEALHGILDRSGVADADLPGMAEDWKKIRATADRDFALWRTFYTATPKSPKAAQLAQEIQWRRIWPSYSMDPPANASSTVLNQRQRAQQNWFNADAKVMSWVNAKEEITIDRIREINRMLREGLPYDDGAPGTFRSGRVFDSPARTYEYLHPRDIQKAMILFDLWLLEGQKTFSAIQLAALAYERLVSIHPFGDANGRTARLVCDWILLAKGYPPTVFLGVVENQVARFAGSSAPFGKAERSATDGLLWVQGRIEAICPGGKCD